MRQRVHKGIVKGIYTVTVSSATAGYPGNLSLLKFNVLTFFEVDKDWSSPIHGTNKLVQRRYKFKAVQIWCQQVSILHDLVSLDSRKNGVGWSNIFKIMRNSSVHASPCRRRESFGPGESFSSFDATGENFESDEQLD